MDLLGNVAKVLRALAAFVVLGVVMGLLAAGLGIPAVAATGQAITGGVKVFNDLPGDLTQTPLNQQSRILDARGGVIATPYSENRIIVPLRQIAPIMRQAQIAIEDSRFYEHGGLDVRGLSRAIVSTAQGDKQGASTLTQQYVKLTLQDKALHEDNPDEYAAAAARSGLEGVSRKLQELKYATKLEQTLTKDQILEGYLNLAYYGDLAYGVEAAAEHYFSIPASRLSYNQSALLAGIVQLPGKTDPVNYPKASQARRDIVLDRMAELRVITAKQAAAAKKVPVRSMLRVKPPLNTCQRSTQFYFCSYVLAWLKQQPALGKDVSERLKNINTKGLTIQTSLDPELTKYAKAKLVDKVPVSDKSNVAAAATVIQPGTGRVLAMAQTTKLPPIGLKCPVLRSQHPPAKTLACYRKGTEVNLNVDTKYGGTSGQQFGSTAKLFALVTALENGIPVNSSVFAKKAGPSESAAAIYKPSENRDRCGYTADPFRVRNDYTTGGKSIPLRVATANSINTAFASLVYRLGLCHVNATETRLGMHRGDGTPMAKFSSSVTLGADEVTPITLASAYATIAANGKYCSPIPVVSIVDSAKKAIKVGQPSCKQVLSPDVAAGVTELLQGVLKFGTAAAVGGLAGGRPAVGKTGTTDDHVESWFVGYTPQLTTAVWVGTPFSQTRMDSVSIGGRGRQDIFGATIAAPIWKQIMDHASQGMPEKSFPDASGKITNGDLISVPDVSGMSIAAAKSRLQDAGFDAYVAGDAGSTVPAGLVASTSPSGSAPKGSAIGLLISTGKIDPSPATKPKPKPKPRFPFPLPTRPPRRH